MTRRHICTIVPPHILKHIAESADEGDRARARDALLLSERLRTERSVLGPSAADRSPGLKERAVYDARHGTGLPGSLVRGEDWPATSDAAVERAFTGAGETYDFYQIVYGRTSVD